MLFHRGNTLKAHQHISYYVVVAVTLLRSIVLYKKITLKKNYTKSDQNIHQDASNCTFFQKFLVA